MIDRATGHLERRVLFLAPTPRDGALTRKTLADAGIDCVCHQSLRALCADLEKGASALLLAEECLAAQERDTLVTWLSRQPPWSDLPVLVLAHKGADSTDIAQVMELLGNVTVLERPMRIAALVSAVRTASRARERQYEMRTQLAEQKLAQESLQEEHRRKDDFLAILAHELRNPLAPIRNALHIMHIRGTRDPSTQGLQQMLERQVDHMVRIVDDLMEVSRITRGKIVLRRERTELRPVIENAVEFSRPLIDAANHRLVITMPDEPIMLDIDPVRVAQVVSNLLNNSAKYTERGGRIAVTVTRDGGFATISVRDSGIGIPREALTRVFDLFTQIERGADRRQGGLGIGLTLVKTLTEMHGGTVGVASEGPGRGSEFTVRLPIAADAVPEPHHGGTRESAGRLSGERVLVVDDNRDAALSLSMLLESLGADTRVEFDGPSALEAVAEFHPTIVLLDIGMHVMDGYEVARRIRLRPEWAGMTLIALTGWGQEEDRLRSRAAGFDFHLVKPADIEVLQSFIASIH